MPTFNNVKCTTISRPQQQQNTNVSISLYELNSGLIHWRLTHDSLSYCNKPFDIKAAKCCYHLGRTGNWFNVTEAVEIPHRKQIVNTKVTLFTKNQFIRHGQPGGEVHNRTAQVWPMGRSIMPDLYNNRNNTAL